MKKTAILLLLIVFPSMVLAVKPRRATQKNVPTEVPATIKTVYYIAGLPEIDTNKYEQKSRTKYKGFLDLEETGVAFKRTRMKQDGKKGLENVTIVQFKYSDITNLFYGHDAIEEAMRGLPTAPKSVYDSTRSMFLGGAYYTPLPEFMQHRSMPPVVIVFKRNGKPVSLIIRGGRSKMEALYNLLAKQANIKVKAITKYP